MNSTFLRLNQTGFYLLRFPVVGQFKDYSVAFEKGLTARQVSQTFLTYNYPWLEQNNIYTHTLVFWVDQKWLIQFFFFEPSYKFSLKFNRRVLRRVLRLVRREISQRNRQSLWNLKPSIVNRARVKTRRLSPGNRSVFHRLFLKWSSHVNNHRQQIDNGFRFFVPNSYLKISYQIKLRRYFRSSKFNFLIFRLARLHRLSFVLLNQESSYSGHNFVFRRLTRKADGNLDLWLSFLKYRVNNRGYYTINSLIFPLDRFLKRNRLQPVGWELRCNGRFTRQQRADHRWFTRGRGAKRNNCNFMVEQRQISFAFKFGAVGLTLTVNYGRPNSNLKPRPV